MTTPLSFTAGAHLFPAGGVRFRLWAPSLAQVQLAWRPASAQGGELDVQAMTRDADGWHECIVERAGPGSRYQFVLPDGTRVPDPASRSNPDGVHEMSAVVDPAAYAWRDGPWSGRPWHEAVIYELHLGTFTPDGTCAAAMARLPELARLGITAIELMPVAAFPGRRGWGYDGVLPFAPQPSYGTPDDLKRFVDAAHGLGLMVLMDVVYNHFGPEGNYLHTVAPEFFNPAHRTPWGAAINMDGEHSRPVRDFFIANALYWVEEFHMDGLRMDAVHAIRDDSPVHLCEEIGEALRALGERSQPPRHVHLVLENDANAAVLLERDERGRPVAADAQWNDDFHHVAHVLATGETDGYYADYAQQPLARLGRAFAEGFVYQGEASALRGGERRGEPSGQLPSLAFVSFLQNHDQIGNRAFGERIAMLADRAAHGTQRLQALRATLLLSPHVPMLFMGEEFAASTPFLYFCDFGPELAAAVTQGRRDEFKQFASFADEAARARIPDPGADATFAACVLRWNERAEPAHAEVLAETGRWLALRTQHLVPRLAHATLGGHASVDGDLLQVEWVLGEGSLWHLALNLGATPAVLPARGDTVLALRADEQLLQPNGLRISLQSTEQGLAKTASAEAAAVIEAAASALTRIADPATAVITPDAAADMSGSGEAIDAPRPAGTPRA